MFFMVCEDSKEPFTPLAQWLEHRIFNPRVMGSIPIGSTKFQTVKFRKI